MKREQGFNNEKTVVEALVKDFHTIWIIDAKTFQMSLYRCLEAEQYGDVISKGEEIGYQHIVDWYTSNFVADKDIERLQDLASEQMVREKLEKDDVYTINFLRKDFSGVMAYHQLYYAKSEDGEYIVLGLKDIDETVKKEIVNQAQVERIRQFEFDVMVMELLHEAMDSGSWHMEFNPDGDMIHCSWSQTFRKMLGYQNSLEFPDELESWVDLMHVEDRDRVMKAYWDAVKDYTGLSSFDETYRLFTKDQGWRYFHSAGRLSRREDGSPVAFVGLFMDVDDKIRADAALQEQLKIVDGLTHEYLNVYKINTKDRSLRVIKLDGYVTTGITDDFSRDYSYDAITRRYVKERVFHQDTEIMLQAMNLDYVLERLKETTEVAFSYRTFEEGRVHHYQCKYIRIEGDATLDRIIVGFKNIDDVIAAAQEREDLIVKSETDLMTGVLNRGSGEVKSRDHVESGAGGMFAVLDVDKFKSINDTYGHAIGDVAIVEVAHKLKQEFGEDNIVYRLGGDEFAVYSPKLLDEESARKRLMHFIKTLDNIESEELANIPLHVSIGAALAKPGESIVFERLYKKADDCVYSSKKVDGSAVTFAKEEETQHEKN